MANSDAVIICRCNDVTEKEVLEAIDAGCTDIETIKRYLHIGMGVCQGRVCTNLVQRALAKKNQEKYGRDWTTCHAATGFDGADGGLGQRGRET